MRGFIVISIIMILLLIFCGSSQAELISEPSEFNIDLVQGEEIQRKITLTNNNNNITITGHIWVINVECGLECPSAHLSIRESDLIELGPQESIKATVYISSHLFNKPQEITLPIEFYSEGYENQTTVAEIHITVHTNYGIYLGVPLIIVIIVVLVIIYFKKIKPRKSE